ncbi:MAG: DUF2683 family protein [Candidatus Woesearchaeota archaeon]
MIAIGERTNRVLNIVKAKYGLKDKSQAIELVVSDYEAQFLERELRPEFVEKIERVEKDGFRHQSLDALRDETENA